MRKLLHGHTHFFFVAFDRLKEILALFGKFGIVHVTLPLAARYSRRR